MIELTKINPRTTAILTLDCQKGIVEFVVGSEGIFKQASKLIKAARARKFRVMHVGIGFRPDYPEVNPEHPTFGPIRQTNRFVIGTDSANFHESISPIANEITIVKHRVSAFSGNDLEMILRAQAVNTLVLFGIATSGIVLSTLRQASDMDFRCVIVKDCCFDSDEEVHRVLTEKIFTRQAAVVTADDVIAAMQ